MLRLKDRIFVLFQYLLPQKLLTRVLGWLADREAGWLTEAVIRAFVSHYQVDLSEAKEPDPSAYPTFNAFFTRALRPGARPLAEGDDVLVSPSDSRVSQAGPLDDLELVQAKGHRYSLEALVAGHGAWIERYRGGSFATLYLSPRDYHRVHTPASGELKETLYVPGDLFSVNPTTARAVPGLFARNERLIVELEGPRGPYLEILVGATIVGSIETTWSGVVTPPHGRDLRAESFPPGAGPSFRKGEEMGRFALGSTVILVFPPGRVRFDGRLRPEAFVHQGERIGRWLA